jgi:putative ABC transport system permease protein
VSRLRTFLSRAFGWLGDRKREADLGREISSHIAEAAEEFERQGVPADEARRRAFVHIGGVTQTVTRARAQLKRHDPDVVVGNVATMTERMADSVAQPRFYSVMLGAFAFVALALAAIGLYGVMSYAVSQHTKEIGIRMALGASRGQVIRLVAGQGLIVTTAGIGAGLAGAFAVTRYLESMLFGLSPFDPATVAGVSVLLAAVAALAIYTAARRAMRVDPMAALRTE